MAYSQRIRTNKAGQVMVPMNLEGYAGDDGFFNTTKLIIGLGTILLTALGVNKALKVQNFTTKLLALAAVIFIAQWVIRKFVLQEDYYSKIYKKSKEYRITTPQVFWAAPIIQDGYEGATVTYVDGKTGVIVRAIRDTITGRTEEMRESHYDAISDFYKSVNQHGFSMVQMNIMEPAGRDPRMGQLDKLVTQPSNRNVAKLMEMQIGYIRKTTRETLYETEYFLIYTKNTFDTSKMVSEVAECAQQLMGGAYTGYEILDRAECIELMKELYGVTYFDYGRATTGAYQGTGAGVHKAFEIKEVRFGDGSKVEVGVQGNIRLQNLASLVLKGDLEDEDWTVKQALDGKVINKLNIKDSKRQVGASKGKTRSEQPEESIYINLDEDIFSVYSESGGAAPQIPGGIEEIGDEAEETEPRKNGLFRKKSVSASFQKRGKLKNGVHSTDTSEEKTVYSEEINQQKLAGEGQEIKVPEGLDDFIDLE